jgi:hypothetical protein
LSVVEPVSGLLTTARVGAYGRPSTMENVNFRCWLPGSTGGGWGNAEHAVSEIISVMK